MNYDDDDILETEDEESVEAEEPSPVDLLLKKLDDISNKLGPDDEDEDEEESAQIALPDAEPEDPTYGFDPEKIAEGAAERAKATFMALGAVRKDLVERFGDDLDDEEVQQIVTALSALPYKELKAAVERQGHVLMAYAKLGEAYKSGKVQQRKKGPKPMPSQSSQAVNGKDPLVAHFEEVFGPIKSKRQLQRLIAESGGFKLP